MENKEGKEMTKQDWIWIGLLICVILLGFLYG